MNFRLVINEEEIKKLVTLSNYIYGSYYPSIIGQEQTDYMVKKFLSFEAIKDNIDQGYLYYIVGDYLGFIALIKEENYLYISKAYLDEKERHKGYFNDIFNFIKDKAFELGYKSIRLNVNKYNYNSIEVYEHLGFKRIKSEEIDIGNNYIMDDYVYEYIMC